MDGVSPQWREYLTNGELSCRKKTPLSDLLLGSPPYFEVALIMFFIFLLDQIEQVNKDGLRWSW